MNSHEQYAALLDAFIDGALSQPEAERVRTHLTTCPECQSYVSDALTMRELFPGLEETPTPDGFAESALAGLPPQKRRRRTQARNVRTPSQWLTPLQWRTQWFKIALPLVACLTLIPLVGGVLRDAAESGGGLTGNAAFSASGSAADIAESKAAVTAGDDTDIDEFADESALDMGVGFGIAPDMGVGFGIAPDMDGGGDTNTNGAALKRAYPAPEPPETEESPDFQTEESAALDFGITAPTLYNDSVDFSETPILGASYGPLDDAGTMPPQAAEDVEKADAATPQAVQNADADAATPQDAETESARQNDAATPQNAATDTAPQNDAMTPQDAGTESAPKNDAMPSQDAPDERQRVSGASGNREASATPATESAEELIDERPVAEAERVTAWRLPPDAASAMERYPCVGKTQSGLWYALTNEEFDALRRDFPDVNLLDADSDDAPPLTSPDSVYLFLPFPD